MSDRSEELRVINDLLTTTFDSVLRIEEKTLRGSMTEGLSISELHAIAAIGLNEMPTMGLVAERMDVTAASANGMVSKLVKKGYAERVRGTKDRRQVLVKLTPAGRKAHRVHAAFHKRMVEEACEGLTQDQLTVFAEAIGRIKAFFARQNEASTR